MKAIIAMSGGVDSSVAAYIMKKRGYEVIGITLKLHSDSNTSDISDEQSCCTQKDIDDARAVCEKLGIEHRLIDRKSNFRHEVIDRFVSAYVSGSTPNPCIDCNRYIKFRLLLDIAKTEGYDCIVTGHYARVMFDEVSGRYLIKKGKDASKDQSYVLYSLTQDDLSRVVLPLGEMSKSEVRAVAQRIGLGVSNKKESQDICFVPDGRYADFISEYTGKKFPDGDFVGLDGKVLGTHKGIIRYTIGQRKGLGLSLPQPLYVCKKDVAANTVTLCRDDQLFSSELYAEDINFISVKEICAPTRVKAKIRYRHTEACATVYPVDGDKLKIVFDEPQRAITSGQAVVMYADDTVVAGGTII